MKANVGGIDRVLRIGVGLLLVLWGFFNESYLVMAIGAIPLLTGLMKWCPAYTLFGINSCTTKSEVS